MKFIKVSTYEEMSGLAANLIAAQVVIKPNCVLGLATGSTPVGTYQRLVELNRAGDVDFSTVTSVNLDEYCGLDTSNDQSYRYFMNHNLFDHVNIDKSRTFVPNGLAADPVAEGKRYDELIASLGGIDLQLLGIGNNGHIGFNEPCGEFVKATHPVKLKESTIKANSRFFEKLEDVPTMAVTMGIGAIMQAKKVLLVANGAGKKEIVENASFGPITPEVPASVLQLHPDVTVIYSEN